MRRDPVDQISIMHLIGPGSCTHDFTRKEFGTTGTAKQLWECHLLMYLHNTSGPHMQQHTPIHNLKRRILNTCFLNFHHKSCRSSINSMKIRPNTPLPLALSQTPRCLLIYTHFNSPAAQFKKQKSKEFPYLQLL